MSQAHSPHIHLKSEITNHKYMHSRYKRLQQDIQIYTFFSLHYTLRLHELQENMVHLHQKQF